MQSSRERTYAVDQLEPRRLLADTFNATSGNDVIEISATSTITTIKINGTVQQRCGRDQRQRRRGQRLVQGARHPCLCPDPPERAGRQ